MKSATHLTRQALCVTIVLLLLAELNTEEPFLSKILWGRLGSARIFSAYKKSLHEQLQNPQFCRRALSSINDKPLFFAGNNHKALYDPRFTIPPTNIPFPAQGIEPIRIWLEEEETPKSVKKVGEKSYEIHRTRLNVEFFYKTPNTRAVYQKIQIPLAIMTDPEHFNEIRDCAALVLE